VVIRAADVRAVHRRRRRARGGSGRGEAATRGVYDVGRIGNGPVWSQQQRRRQQRRQKTWWQCSRNVRECKRREAKFVGKRHRAESEPNGHAVRQDKQGGADVGSAVSSPRLSVVSLHRHTATHNEDGLGRCRGRRCRGGRCRGGRCRGGRSGGARPIGRRRRRESGRRATSLQSKYHAGNPSPQKRSVN